MQDRHPEAEGRCAARFPTTRWSLILLAGRQEPTAECEDALASLCASYWYALYAFARHLGNPVEDAKDLTQGFFVRLLEKNYLREFKQERGRFRTFLLAAFQHYAANERHHAHAQKRRGHHTALSLDFEDAEGRYRQEPVDVQTPQRIFERRWALTVLDRALARVGKEYAGGRRAWFDRLRCFLTGEPREFPYSQLAAELQTSEGAIRLAVHRLRRRFREALQAEVAETVADAAEIEDEIQFLIAAVGRRP
ncbi:MAG: sigma-70 family RNA polymerase sigma factor [Acidobacteriia bacterium]|nr:sigma-70 family RNA polymerase sigma factor [Terriglobia bacterium]